MPIFLANDHYEGFLQTTYNPGESVFALDNLPLNVPTIVVSAPGTEYEAVFTVTGKTINALTGVARIRGYNGVLVEGTAITCLNNEEFINQYRTYLGIDWRGDWDNATAYAIQDGVAYNNTSYVAIQAGTNHLPTDTDYWQIVGVQGSQGIQGEPGTNGLGVPDGGATGEVLKKKSNADNDTEWGVGGLTQAQIVDLIYPVGSIYISITATNPGTVFGFGTWVAFGAGKTLVGINASETEFNTVEKTGGAKTITLTSAQSGLPSHNHTQNAHSHTFYVSGADDNNHTGNQWNGNDVQAANSDANNATTKTSHLTTPTNNANPAADAASAHSNLQPYIVTYMFKRTA